MVVIILCGFQLKVGSSGLSKTAWNV